MSFSFGIVAAVARLINAFKGPLGGHLSPQGDASLKDIATQLDRYNKNKKMSAEIQQSIVCNIDVLVDDVHRIENLAVENAFLDTQIKSLKILNKELQEENERVNQQKLSTQEDVEYYRDKFFKLIRTLQKTALMEFIDLPEDELHVEESDQMTSEKKSIQK